LSIFILSIFSESLANYLPGVETWAKLFNLLLFVAIVTYILRRPLGEALRARREGIRHELMRAQEERNAALGKLAEVESRLAKLDADVEAIHAQAKKEADEERLRIERSAEEDSRKLREQARREIENASKLARHGLRRYASEQSIRIAEDVVRRNINADDDARLVSDYVEDLGGLSR
jgi:ATP synthase F0 subunit b